MTEHEKADRAMIETIWRQHHGYGPDRELAMSDREWTFLRCLLDARVNYAHLGEPSGEGSLDGEDEADDYDRPPIGVMV